MRPPYSLPSHSSYGVGPNAPVVEHAAERDVEHAAERDVERDAERDRRVSQS
jgi:hypothetical protein